MSNPAVLFTIRRIEKNMQSKLEKANSFIKENIDIQSLSEAKIVSYENLEYYRNLQDIYVKVDFGNNVILPFYIDKNIATSLKIIEPKTSDEITIKSVTELKKMYGMSAKATIYDIQNAIIDEFGIELPVEEKESITYKSLKADLKEVSKELRESVWEASLKKFTGKMERIIEDPTLLAGDSESVREIKQTTNILKMMENKQKDILETKGVKENSFISVQKTTRKSFNKESIESFLKDLKEKNPKRYEEISKPKKERMEQTLRMVGIFHLDELINISPEIQSLLDMELNNKVSYKIKLMKEGKLQNKEEETEEVLIGNTKSDFKDTEFFMSEENEMDEDLKVLQDFEDLEELDYENSSPSF